MLTEIQSLLDQYLAWLKDKTVLREIGEWTEITTPYLDRHNDYLQIYVKRQDHGFLLTDDGYVLEDLEQSGCKIEHGKRRALLEMTLRGFGIQLRDGTLEVTASTDNFALRKHNLVQAILAVNDLFYLAAPMVESIFYEDVINWFDSQEVRYTPKVKFAGKSGYDHLFDFAIPKSRNRPERIVQAINRPSKETAQNLVFSWFDTRDARSQESWAIALLNDSDKHVPPSVLDALRSYEIRPFLWSERAQFIQEFAL